MQLLKIRKQDNKSILKIKKNKKNQLSPHQKKKLEKLNARAREIILEARDEAVNIKERAVKELKDRLQQANNRETKLDQRQHRLEKLEQDLKKRQQKLESDTQELENERDQYRQKQAELIKKLEKSSSLTSSEAKKELLLQVKKNSQADIARAIKEAEETANFKAEETAREILVEAIRSGATDYVSEFTVSTIKISDEETKSRVIGKEGRNIRAFEKLTGVDLIMDETPGEIKISSFNSIRREIARVALERLIKDGRIQPTRIEEYVAKAKSDIEKVVFQEGRKLCQSLNIFNIPRELISILGRFKFRSSYGQNMVAHTLEVVKIGTKLAQEIGANVQTVKYGCLFHDIGKVIDGDGSHVELGVKLLKKYNLPQAVIDAVGQHHEDVPFTSPESILVYVADAVSGARSGARRENVEEYIKRIKELEKIALNNPEVKEAYAIQAGREVRVIVYPEKISDDGLTILAANIRDQIKDNLTYPGTIKVNVIREVRASEVAR